MTERLRKSAWQVVPVHVTLAQAMIERLHYAKGGSNTAVYTFGLVPRGDATSVKGVTWWLPPTRVAAESVSPEWQRVLSLTRMVIEPGMPKNAASFMLSQSVKLIRRDARFHTLVTYADEWAGHDGHVYRASGWEYVGKTGPYPKWVSADGKQVAAKATVNRTKAEMEALGHTLLGSFYKHKYVLRLKCRMRYVPEQMDLLV